MRVAVIDGDTLVWVAAYNNRDQEGTSEMFSGIDAMLTELLLNTQADQYVGLIKGKEASHRAKHFADYKANRPPVPDWIVKWKKDIEAFLIDKWKFQFVNGIEVDDAVISVAAIIEPKGDVPIICSVDKDFQQYPGWHYNPRKKELKFIGGDDAYEFL